VTAAAAFVAATIREPFECSHPSSQTVTPPMILRTLLRLLESFDDHLVPLDDDVAFD
jgi:hypothetical protein